jgi:CRISPR-associated endoribonuclease Cas6
MFRLRIDIKKENCKNQNVMSHCGQIKNIFNTALRKYGYCQETNKPAKYGFGAIIRKIDNTTNRSLYRVDRIWIGSADQTIAKAISMITPEDLLEPTMTPGAGLDLRKNARFYIETVNNASGVVQCFTNTPIRILSGRGNNKQTLFDFGEEFNINLNKNLETRFGKPFSLKFVPDNTFVRLNKGRVVKSLPVAGHINGQKDVVFYWPGVVVPFVLIGPPEDINTVLSSGLGTGTGMGFGWISPSGEGQ